MCHGNKTTVFERLRQISKPFVQMSLPQNGPSINGIVLPARKTVYENTSDFDYLEKTRVRGITVFFIYCGCVNNVGSNSSAVVYG